MGEKAKGVAEKGKEKSGEKGSGKSGLSGLTDKLPDSVTDNVGKAKKVKNVVESKK